MSIYMAVEFVDHWEILEKVCTIFLIGLRYIICFMGSAVLLGWRSGAGQCWVVGGKAIDLINLIIHYII